MVIRTDSFIQDRITTGVAIEDMSTDFPGLTPAQSDLIQHWRICCRDGFLPLREQLDPGEMRAHLAAISIVELRQDGEAHFRLVGSGLRPVFGCDMRGRRLGELNPPAFEMWSLGLERSCDEQRPVGGLIERTHDTHAWLRLPLRRTARAVQVLCHDTLIPNARFRGGSDTEFDTPLVSDHNLAA